DMARHMRLLSAIQQNDLVPDWDTNWNGAIMRYKGVIGASATLTDSGTLIQFNLQNSAGTIPVYRRAHNANQSNVPGTFVPGWPAYSGSQVLGLDPAYQFWLDPLLPDSALPQTHITSLTEGVRLGLGTGTLVMPDFTYFRLMSPARGNVDVADITLSVP